MSTKRERREQAGIDLSGCHAYVDDYQSVQCATPPAYEVILACLCEDDDTFNVCGDHARVVREQVGGVECMLCGGDARLVRISTLAR